MVVPATTASMLACEMSTPLGLAVDPLVYMSTQIWLAVTGGGGA